MADLEKPDPNFEDNNHETEFRDFLERAYGVTDESLQDLVVAMFNYSVLEAAYRRGMLSNFDPADAAEQELIAQGVTDPVKQRPTLQRVYLEFEDPRWSE